MKIIYRASDIVEAHIVAGMLEAQGLDTHVGGHYLQGGIGDLAPMGHANVFVRDEDTDAAQAIVEQYEGASGETLGETLEDDLPAGTCKPA